MTGTQLLEALSFVDGRYIAEADVPLAGRSTPWMKVLSVAACLCILITGVYAYSRMQSKGAMESMKEMEAAAAPAEAPASPAATVAEPEAAPREEAVTEAPAEEAPAAAAGELQPIPYARLRILGQTEAGWAAVVEEVSDEPTPLEPGMELTIVFDASKVPGNTKEVTTDPRALTENAPVAVEDAAYDADTNILYVVEIFLLRED